MRIVFVGGTGPVGQAAIAHLDGHDVAVAHSGAPRITILRPGAIYGPHDHAHLTREWYLVGKVVRGERALTLPHGGTQLFHRVALDRVGRAVAGCARRDVGVQRR